MNLDKVEQRHKVIKDLIGEAHEFKLLAREFDDDNDWAGAKVILDDLTAVERLIRAEEIFLETFDMLGDVRHPDRDEKEHWLTIFLVDGVHDFVHEILLRDLEYMLKVLNDWGFRTEEGEEFRKYVDERLEPLIKKYKILYDI